ncbi:hypothetical protein MLD38_039646 [Melastoma candidum]|uniref:Uncharacterized protein n=1 Tax=Melastoma candidum TaxID=119954 RepID=A0ACB9L3Z8_9MYRT|nr:hypothetical protein MLD38_039646 [Melastoma candidum]
MRIGFGTNGIPLYKCEECTFLDEGFRCSRRTGDLTGFTSSGGGIPRVVTCGGPVLTCSRNVSYYWQQNVANFKDCLLAGKTVLEKLQLHGGGLQGSVPCHPEQASFWTGPAVGCDLDSGLLSHIFASSFQRCPLEERKLRRGNATGVGLVARATEELGPVTSRHAAFVLSNLMNAPEYEVLDITRLSSRRKDAHSSLYYLSPLSSGKGKDCSQWCPPGVSDSWNKLLLALYLKHQIPGQGTHRQISRKYDHTQLKTSVTPINLVHR